MLLALVPGTSKQLMFRDGERALQDYMQSIKLNPNSPGALFGPLIGDGEYWRLVTSGFLHAGFLHIARGAGVPVLMVGLDYSTRTVRIGPFRPSLAGGGLRDAVVGRQTIRLRPDRNPTRSTARPRIGVSMLSSSTTSAPPTARTSASCAKVSTSISTFIIGSRSTGAAALQASLKAIAAAIGGAGAAAGAGAVWARHRKPPLKRP